MALDLSAILRGDTCECACCQLHRRIMRDITDEGLILVISDVLAQVAADGPADGTIARRLALVALPQTDFDLPAEALVDMMWRDRTTDTGRLETERAAA